MSQPKPTPTAPAKTADRGLDFARGVALAAMAENVPLAGFVGKDDVVGVRQGERVFVVGAKCSHYGAPMAKGRVDGDSLMCPWHHACFSLKDGAASKAPALAPIASYVTRVRDGKVVASHKAPIARRAGVKTAPKKVTIVGAGGAAFSAIAELRQQGYEGPIEVFGGEKAAPYDRPKLSKAFLGGGASEKSLALNGDFIAQQAGPKAAKVTWHLGKRVEKIAPATKTLVLAGGENHSYEALILATGAKANDPKIPGQALAHVYTLRSLEDGSRLKQATDKASSVLIVGASFIGLEAASALRQRDVLVHVIAQDKAPMAKVLGPDVGQALFHLHTDKGVNFHVGAKVKNIGAKHVTLADGSQIAADVVLLATGVVPEMDLARSAGIACDNGILVDKQLQTNVAGIWAAGDAACWPYEKDGKPIRIEHWSVAEQMGRVAARNVLGQQESFSSVPFFWTEHYDMKVRYVGHTRTLQYGETFGDLEARKAGVALYENDTLEAVLTVGCDDISMGCEAALAAGKPQDALALLRTV